ncbi:MAG: sigma-70 family RNA polymerase sigma factor [Planctomycetaceae bacterium]
MALTEIDRNLLRRCLAQEPGAWKDLVDRFIGLFVHVIHHTAQARSVGVRPEDVDDICAEIFTTLVSRDFAVLRNFRGNSSLATYLTVVARRIVVREMSRRKMAEALGHVQVNRTSLEKVRTQPSDFKRIEDRDEVHQLLKVLPAADAEIVRLFHLEGRSYGEISSGLGIPENTIGPVLTRARRKLAERKVQS